LFHNKVLVASSLGSKIALNNHCFKMYKNILVIFL